MTAERKQAPDLCMVIADLSPGGAQRVFSQLANAWASRGRRLCVVTLSPVEEDFFQLAPQIRRISIGGQSDSRGLIAALGANYARIRRLRSALKQSGAQTVLSFVGVMNILTVLATRGLGLTVAISERNDPARQSLGRLWDFLRRHTYALADIVTANSSGAVETLADYVERKKLTLVANPVAPKTSSQTADLPGPVILNVGRLAPQKAQDVLLEAFAKVLRGSPEWHLVIIGTGPLEGALKDQAKRLGIADKVLFTGQVDDPFSYYRAARIFALPSNFEGTPNTLLEAMSSGLASVVSDASSGPLDFVSHDETGLVVPAGDPVELAEALTRLIADPGLRGRLGDAAKVRTAALGIDAILPVWEALLRLSPPPPIAGS